ncbi:ankyrin repeat protein [Acanthamoeba polyphaga moumouvirus]|uniref:Ankyrin repeat protein n=1 Tax=Acanthamoeba polyphaga moumouvirus TaxID=1269028 RepID=L7RG23_9VIRU|nr:ankyrin repeat protein [Acanthamoeba polyphaga moumouvirus]AGC01925.1 ankyrin repeat protein [Acanthamoeba polyphaga moumouvirus]
MSNITKILKIDQKHRTKGITGDLHTIDTVVSDLTLDYDLPTLCNKRTDKPNILMNNIEKFTEEFYKKYPFLKNVNMDNLLIAGGSVSNIIRGDKSSGDIDFFVYGLNTKKATKRVEQWLLDILVYNNTKKKNNTKTKKVSNDSESEDDDDYEEENKFNDSDEKNKYIIDDYKIIKNKSSISILINHDDFKVQLIFRLYKSISEILHGFDLGSSAVGFDGKQVYFTSLGKFCHEYSCNIIDTTRRSTTYEYRLIKYFDRGFNIVLPKLNLGKLRTSYLKYGEIEICEMPYFVFAYSEITGNKIRVKNFYNKFTSSSDYELEPMDPINVYYQSLKINIVNLINDVDYFYYVSSQIDENNVDILTKPPRITKGNIINFYDEIRQKLNKRNIDVNLIKRYINVDKVENIVSNMFDPDVNTSEYFDELIEKQKKSAFKKLNKLLNQEHNIDWITDNPGTQLTSSFNPIIEDEVNWYGKRYYKSK